MNWTGGRLQRHSLSSRSNANKSLRAVQKQHFAKKRLATRNGRGNSVSPIKLLGINAGLSGERDDTSGNGSKARTQEKSRFFGGDERQGGSGREGDIETIRRNLLRRDDWANLSLSRPLKMTFSSTRAERDNLGKRRRLTERDRCRLTAMRDSRDGYTCRISELRKRSSSVFDPDAISIRIGQPGMGRGVSATPASEARTMQILSQDTSNESMLFDGEERRRRTQSILVERSDSIRSSDEESVQQLMSQEMDVSDSQDHEVEEQEIPEERDQEEFTMLTSENSIPLPVLHPHGSFQRNEDGQLRYNPPVNQDMEDQAILDERREDLLTSSSPEKSRGRRAQVPLWAPQAIEANPRINWNLWQRTAIDQFQYPWTSRPTRQSLDEEYPTAFRQPFTRRSTHCLNEMANKENLGSQRNLFIDQEGSDSIQGVPGRQTTTGIPWSGNQRHNVMQGRLRIDSDGHVFIARRTDERDRNSLALPDGKQLLGTTTGDRERPRNVPLCTATEGTHVPLDTGPREIRNRVERKDTSPSRQLAEQESDRSEMDGDGDEMWRNFVLG